MNYHRQKVVIALGASASTLVDIAGADSIGLIMPAAFTGTEVAVYVAATASATPVPLYDESGNAVTATVAASTAVGLWTADSFPWQWVQLVSNGTEAAAREITLVLKD